MTSACSVHVRGTVQGVGFRPFVFRLARTNTLAGWVSNDESGVAIHIEGEQAHVQAFIAGLRDGPPVAASITQIDVAPAAPSGVRGFTIRESERRDHPTVHITPDLATCDACLREMFDPDDARYRYPYINCTDCGPRYSIIRRLPYDRANTTMAAWPLSGDCAREYEDPATRRFHAQPVACSACGPDYVLHDASSDVRGSPAIAGAISRLAAGRILAIKGLGGYHLACDASNADAVRALRARKFRKDKPFAVMAKDIATARNLVLMSDGDSSLLESPAGPIVVMPARSRLPGVAPGNDELGVMLPYTPLHHLLFEGGAPRVLVMTSANRSSEPIAYEDADAIARLAGIADAFLIGERPIARRVEDSVVRSSSRGPAVLRRSRGYAPAPAATLPPGPPVLATGADLKSAVTLAVDGTAFVSPYLGDLSDWQALRAFRETIDDWIEMYGLDMADVVVAHDLHPQYLSTGIALGLPARTHVAIQHHRAHIASVVAERGELRERVLGISLDGTGYGDDGAIWGCELFVGSAAAGFERVAHLRQAALPGGDAAAAHPVQAAAGFLEQLDALPDLRRQPFGFPARYDDARKLLDRGLRVHPTTSAGRLFDAVAALVGFTRPQTFEGQAAIWLEQLALDAPPVHPYDFPFADRELDFRPLLRSVIEDRVAGREPELIARAFHGAIARGLATASRRLCAEQGLRHVVVSGGVFQNRLLCEDLCAFAGEAGLEVWMNHVVPSNDGGISLGQAALAAAKVS